MEPLPLLESHRSVAWLLQRDRLRLATKIRRFSCWRLPLKYGRKGMAIGITFCESHGQHDALPLPRPELSSGVPPLHYACTTKVGVLLPVRLACLLILEPCSSSPCLWACDSRQVFPASSNDYSPDRVCNNPRRTLELLESWAKADAFDACSSVQSGRTPTWGTQTSCASTTTARPTDFWYRCDSTSTVHNSVIDESPRPRS